MEEKKEKPLIIPENSPPVKYVINGFTSTDIVYVAVLTIIGAVVGIIFWQDSGNPLIAVIVCCLFFGLTVMFRMRNADTENVIDLIKIFFVYLQAQKKFEYEYINIWEVSERNTINGNRKK